MQPDQDAQLRALAQAWAGNAGSPRPQNTRQWLSNYSARVIQSNTLKGINHDWWTWWESISWKAVRVALSRRK